MYYSKKISAVHMRHAETPIRQCLLVFMQAQQLLLEFQAGLLEYATLKDHQRAKICTVLAVADKCLVDGADEFLQLLHVASVAQQAICSA